jgi:hypothetical protein
MPHAAVTSDRSWPLQKLAVQFEERVLPIAADITSALDGDDYRTRYPAADRDGRKWFLSLALLLEYESDRSLRSFVR